MSFYVNAKLVDNNSMAFVIGALSVLPYLFPTMVSLNATPEYNLYRYVDLETRLLYLPIACGILHIILFNVITKMFTPSMRTYWVLGMIVGLIYASYDLYNEYYSNVYGFKNVWSLYLMDQIVFLIFYGVIINYLFIGVR